MQSILGISVFGCLTNRAGSHPQTTSAVHLNRRHDLAGIAREPIVCPQRCDSTRAVFTSVGKKSESVYPSQEAESYVKHVILYLRGSIYVSSSSAFGGWLHCAEKFVLYGDSSIQSTGRKNEKNGRHRLHPSSVAGEDRPHSQHRVATSPSNGKGELFVPDRI